MAAGENQQQASSAPKGRAKRAGALHRLSRDMSRGAVKGGVGLARAIGGFFRWIAIMAGRGVLAVWRTAEMLDGALWRGVKVIARRGARGFRALARLIWRALRDLGRWFPTRAGAAYTAVFGVVIIISGLWIIDEMRAAPEEVTLSGSRPDAVPVDERDPILARMGGRYVHLSDIEAAARIGGQLGVGESLTPSSAFSRGLVENYVEQRLLADAAVALDLDKQDLVADRLAIARERILASAFLEQQIAEAVDDEAVRRLYDAQSDVTRLGDEVKARHIVVKTRAEAEEILGALEAGGDFAALARERSLDPSTARLGGEIDFFTKDLVTPGFAAAAFSTEPGDIAPLFESDYGWHVLEVTQRRPTQSVSYDEVKQSIREFLTQRAIERIMEQLRRQENVSYYEPAPMMFLRPELGDGAAATEDAPSETAAAID